MPDAEGQSDGAIRRIPQSLQRRERAFAMVAGGALVAAGAAAVFLTDNGLGTLALIAAGLILLILGITGKLPSKVAYGDKSIEWVQELAETSLNSASSVGEKNEVIANLSSDRVSEPAQRAVNAAIGSYVGYEQAVIAALNRVKPRDAVATAERKTGPSQIADAMLSEGASNLLIEIKYRSSHRLSGSEIFPILNRVGLVNAKMGSANLLIVANVPLTASAQEALSATSASFVQWRGEEDDPALAAAIRSALSQRPSF